MATEKPRRLFPLHLTTIEKFLLADDRPKYPMTFVIDMDFSGELNREAFHNALSAALERHPLLKCHIRPAKQNALCWVLAKKASTPVDWGKEGEPIQLPSGEWIDLREETGLRMWIRQGDNRVRMTIQFQHVCCDGIGAYRFLGDLLAIYGAQTAADEDQRPTLGEIDTQRLRTRTDGMGHLAGKDQYGSIRDNFRTFRQIVGQGCDPLFPANRSHSTTEYPGYCSFTFNEDEIKRLREAARVVNGTLNDLLLLELFYTMHKWNIANRKKLWGRTYRIMMPVDLRETTDYATPAANIVGYSFVSHKASELNDRCAVAASIREKTALIKHERHGQRFVDMVAIGSRVPGLLPLTVSVPRTLATVILSNIGDPSRRFLAKFPRKRGRVICGNLTLDMISGYPPIRPRTRGSFSVVNYGKALTIGLRCDPHLFSMEDTQEMLEIFVGQLKASLAAG